MGNNFVDILSLFTHPPGSLVYHMLLCLVWLLILIFSAVDLSKKSHPKPAKHLLTGAAVLLTLQFASLLLDFLLYPVNDDPTFYLVGEQFVGSLLILWLTWTFLQESKPLEFTTMSIFITLGLVLFLAVSILLTLFQPTGFPNLVNWLKILWDGFSLILIILGMILSLVTKPGQWELAISMLLTLGAGYALPRLFMLEPSAILGGVRLAHILSLPWSLILLQRLKGKKPDTSKLAARISTDTQRSDPTPILVDELLKISLQESRIERAKASARALCYSVIADICYLAQISEGHNTLELIAGYDLIREENIPTASLPRSQLPHIIDAWEAQRRLAFSERDAASRDADTLTQLLRYHRLGNLLAIPLNMPSRGLVGGVIFLSPYTDKFFGEKVRLLMKKIGPTLSRVLFEPIPFERIRTDLARAEAAVEDLLAEKNALTKAFTRLGATIDAQEGTIRRLKARAQVERLEAIKQFQDYQAQIDAFQSKVDALKGHLVNGEQLQQEIRQITIERDDLKASLDRLTARLMELKQVSGQTGPIRLSMENKVLSLNSILANVRHKITAHLQRKTIQLEIINPNGKQMVRTDPILLQSALEGLLENAIQASTPGSKIQINQELSFETGMLIVQITDFGHGLSGEEQHAFFSAEGASPPGIGSLASIREAIRAIRLLNGKIWIKSEKDHFTTFRVMLPVRIID